MLFCALQHCVWCYVLLFSFFSMSTTRPSLTLEGIQRSVRKRELTKYENRIYNKKAITSLGCTNAISGNYARQISILSSICVIIFPTKFPSEKKDFWNLFKMEVCFVIINPSLKYKRTSGKVMPFFQQSSRAVVLPEMTLVRLWKKTLRKKDFCLNLGDAYFELFLGEWNNHYTVATFYFDFGLDCKKFIGFCNTLQWSVSTILFSL